MGKDKENSDLGPDGTDGRAESGDSALAKEGSTPDGFGDDCDPKIMTGWGPTVCRDAGEEMEARMRGVPEHNIVRK